MANCPECEAAIDMEIEDGIAVARMNNGDINAINPELIAELSLITGRIQKEATAMILTGNDRFFSIGFDLPRVMEFDRPGLSSYLFDLILGFDNFFN